MKVIFEFNEIEIENIIKEYCADKLDNDNSCLSSIELSIMVPSEERGKRECKCTLEYDYKTKKENE